MTISPELISGILSFLFTLMILSYLIGDNPLFRVAVYIFVGVASGFAAAVLFNQVLMPRLFTPLMPAIFTGSVFDKINVIAPLFGAVFILMKISPRMSGIARLAMAYLVGAGAAVALAGAVTGTLIPQVQATITVYDQNAAAAQGMGLFEMLFSGGVILLGTVTSLAYFHFGARTKPDGSTKRFAPVELLALIGKIFIGSTLGVIFAGVYAAALTALIERISSLFEFVSLMRGFFGF